MTNDRFEMKQDGDTWTITDTQTGRVWTGMVDATWRIILAAAVRTSAKLDASSRQRTYAEENVRIAERLSAAGFTELAAAYQVTAALHMAAASDIEAKATDGDDRVKEIA